MNQREKIKNYWDGRAAQNPNSVVATTDDVFLRELEINTIAETIRSFDFKSDAMIVDIGCGDGYSLLGLAKILTNLSFDGIDYSPNMIANANSRLLGLPSLAQRVKFFVGDVMSLQDSLGDGQYQCAITDRCLINLDSYENQVHAIGQIANHVVSGGYYIAVENFLEGQQNLNEARVKLGIPEIPIRWHNLFFSEQGFVDAVKPFFDVIEIKDFSSSYYFATRIIYSKMCRMNNETPDYTHDIHKLAVDLPPIGQFSPIRMAVLKKV